MDSFDQDRRRADARAAQPLIRAALRELELEAAKDIFAADRGDHLNELRLRVQGARLLAARIDAWGLDSLEIMNA